MTWLYLWPLQRYNHQMNTELYNYTHVQTHTQMIGRKRMITMKKEKETGEESLCNSEISRETLQTVLQTEQSMLLFCFSIHV